MRTTVLSYYGLLETGTKSLQSVFLLLVRLYWGWQFAQTGWGKLHNMDKVTGFFTSLGLPLPGPTAHFIAGLEFCGGLLLILGLASRLIALPLTLNMLVAYIVADRQALLSVIADPDKFTAAASFTFLIASIIVLLFGPGKLSLDAWIEATLPTNTGRAAALANAE